MTDPFDFNGEWEKDGTYQIPETPLKEENKFDFDNDFGFSFKPVVEELQKTEEEFKKKFAAQQSKHEETLTTAQEKLKTLYEMIMPLLVNLTKEPEKVYIVWEKRVEKVNAFIDKINNLMES